MGSLSSKEVDQCGICRNTTRGTNRQRVSPGCCNIWYHHDCLNNIINSGGTLCPNCRTQLPPNLLTNNNNNNVILPPQPPSPGLFQSNYNSSRSFQNNLFQSNARPEEPIIPWVPPSSESIQSSLLNSQIQVNCTPELNEISCEGYSKFHVLVTMSCVESTPPLATIVEASAPSQEELLTKDDINVAIPAAAVVIATPSPNTTPSPSSSSTTTTSKPSRPPLDIICVLDTSGSMGSDNKLENLKFAVNYIRGELNEFDRLSIVTFENSAVGIHNLLRMTDENKLYSSSLCSQLRPGGGTSILSGLKAASTILENRTTRNPITSVFLLTDGQDGCSVPEKKTTAQYIKSVGASLFVYGFGADHDSKHLQMIAESATGTFTYIERSDTVIDAFGGAIGAEQSMFATNICLTINSNNNIMITSTESGSYRNELDTSGSNTKVYFNNIMLGEERDILLSLAIPTITITNQIDQLLLSTNISYTLIGASQSTNIIGHDCSIRRFPLNEIANLSTQRNESVDVQVNRIKLVKATKQSLEYADNGNYEQAKKLVEETIKDIEGSSSMKNSNAKTKAFIGELNTTLTNVRSSDIYQTKGGRALLSQQQQDYGMQRQAYARDGTEGIYQNKFSKSSQTKAKNLKSSY